MLGWLFKKKGSTPPATAATAAEARRAAPAAAAATAQAPKPPPVDWAARLAQADGDDALLALLQTAAMPLPFKQAAVEALAGEAALAAAEREFRSHDRRVHQLAKRRLQARVAQRQTHEQAARLIAAARLLADAPTMAVNRSIELDRAWQALDPTAVDPVQRAEFTALTARLATLLQQRSDAERQHKRWLADALQATRQLLAAATEAAAGTQDRAALAAAAAAARAVAQALAADDHHPAALQTAQAGLQQALATADALDGQLAVLEPLLQAPADTAAAHAAWQALPAVPDATLAAQLQARHARWQQAQHEARHQALAQARDQERSAHLAQRRQQAGDRARARDVDDDALADQLTQADTALDAGQLADAQRLLADIDGALQGSAAPDALLARLTAAQARLHQLRGWQQWAGGRARDELVLQAEALAAATLNTAPADAAQRVTDGRGTDSGDGIGESGSSDGNDGNGGGDSNGGADSDATAGSAVQPAAVGEAASEARSQATSEADAEVARLSVRQRADVIATLRARWKEIDRAGGAGGRALWQRFDAALQIAHAPVAAAAAQQRAARDSNLASRVQLLEALEALQPQPAADAAGEQAPASAQDLAAALNRFQLGWRKLGPLEHTVPRAAQAAVAARLQAAVQRVEQPLHALRSQARGQRDGLVAQARALAGDGTVRDLVGEVRMLQASWQQHAKAVPLARADEQALWGDFKAAIDAAFAARDAVFSARDAEFEAHAAERLALIERLQIRPDDSLATQRRLLADVDAAWQACGPAPRAQAAALDHGFRQARGKLQQWLDDAAQRAWHASCDALDSKLALCLAREQHGTAPSPDSWQALPVLPAPLEAALRHRAGLDAAAVPSASPASDALLLQLETTWELPTPPAFEAQRRERKLLAMKAALEGRRPAADDGLPPAAALALLLGRASLDEGQRARLTTVLAARRRQGPQG